MKNNSNKSTLLKATFELEAIKKLCSTGSPRTTNNFFMKELSLVSYEKIKEKIKKIYWPSENIIINY